MPRILLIISIILLTPAAPITANVFDTDDRQELGATENPNWAAVGRISYEGGYCTATLVGRSLILTARYCAFNADGSWKTRITFTPNSSDVWYEVSVGVHRSWGDQTGAYDWALLSLTQPLGDYIRRWNIDMYGTNDNAAYIVPVSLIGFSDDIGGGTKLFITMNCRLEYEWKPGVFGHYCDDYLGSAGAPIVRDHSSGFSIVAMTSGFRGPTAGIGIPESPARSNIAIAGGKIFDHWLNLKDDAPFDVRSLLVCNRLTSGQTSYISLTFLENNAFVARGHWAIESKKCAEFSFGTNEYPVYIHTSVGTPFVGHQPVCRSFCWNPDSIFAVKEGDPCPSGREICYMHINTWANSGRTALVEIGD